MSAEMTIERVQETLTRGPYHQWLGLQVIAVLDDGIEIKATWREEWVVNVERRYTHGGVMAMGVARALIKHGLARGDRVAILAANRTEYLAAYYGIMRAGFVAVPVNFKFPRQTIHFILQDAGAKLVFCDRARRDDCPPD